MTPYCKIQIEKPLYVLAYGGMYTDQARLVEVCFIVEDDNLPSIGINILPANIQDLVTPRGEVEMEIHETPARLIAGLFSERGLIGDSGGGTGTDDLVDNFLGLLTGVLGHGETGGTAYMMLDAGIVAVSSSSVYRVLKDVGLLRKWNRKPSSKGTGFKGPKRAHEHWHIDVSYINRGFVNDLYH